MSLLLAPLPSSSLGVWSSQRPAHPDRDLGTLCVYWWWPCYVACVCLMLKRQMKRSFSPKSLIGVPAA